ncbi:MAG: hypothetical protein H7175_06435 [Burkholderiales bacterium]|nr:hypothetical protein [Anaerolineae bacterium]
MLRLKLILLLMVSMFGMALPTFAQEMDGKVLAAVHDNNVWLYAPDADPQQITDGTANDYSNLVWSADGTALAFIALDENFAATLWLYNRADASLTEVGSDVPAGSPVSFTGDSSQLVFSQDVTPPGSTDTNPIDIYTFDLATNTAAQITTVDIGEGCGGGSSFPGDWRYWNETDGFGGFHSVLELTPFGLVYSKDCGYSTALLNVETGEEVSLGSISRVSVSPDGTQAAGITYLSGDRTSEQLAVVDLASGAVTTLETPAIPDQVTWGANSNELLYSTRQMTDQMIPTTDEAFERINTVLGTSGQVHVWASSIHRFDLASNTDTEVYLADAYAIGWMSAASDGTLNFSQIANAEALLEAIGAGTLDQSDPAAFTASINLVPVELFTLPLDGSDAQLIGTDLTEGAVAAQ